MSNIEAYNILQFVQKNNYLINNLIMLLTKSFQQNFLY